MTREITPYVGNATNDMIVPYALLRHHAESKTGSFSTMNTETYSPIYFGQLERSLAGVLRDRWRKRTIKQVIYSYNTPIAWLDGETSYWMIPDARYSATTTIKHQSRLHQLPFKRYIPEDVSYDEYMRVLYQKMDFVRGKNGKIDCTVPGIMFNND